MLQCPPDPERTLRALESVHDPAYVARLKAACDAAPEGDAAAFSLFDSPDNPISGRDVRGRVSRRRASSSRPSTPSSRSGADAVFVASRPPGHHALGAQAMGFCFFNTIAVAARDLVERAGATRVLVADFDVHHGNGTQEIFWEDGRVAYLSVHRFPFYPGTGAADETGGGQGPRRDGERPAAGGRGGRRVRGRILGRPRGARGAVQARVRPRVGRVRRPRGATRSGECASRPRASRGCRARSRRSPRRSRAGGSCRSSRAATTRRGWPSAVAHVRVLAGAALAVAASRKWLI